MIAMSSSTQSDGEEREDPYLYYRTSMYERGDGDVVVSTDPHQTDSRLYLFRRLRDGRFLAPREATWHTIRYMQEECGQEVLTPGVSTAQKLLHDFADD